jgi:hypothetical protein
VQRECLSSDGLSVDLGDDEGEGDEEGDDEVFGFAEGEDLDLEGYLDDDDDDDSGSRTGVDS